MHIYFIHSIIVFLSIAILLLLGNRIEPIYRNLFQFLYDRITNRGLKYGLHWDEEGYPLYNYGRRNNRFIGYQYNPIVLCWLADKLYNGTDTTEDNRIKIKQYADLAAKKHLRNGVFTAEMNFCWPSYGIENKWSSGLVYGRLIQLFVRAFNVSNNEEYLDYAESVLDNFCKSIDEGGVRILLSEDEWWYEEYASTEIEPPMVLNGMISTVLCISEIHEKRKSRTSAILIEKGILAIANNIRKFDRDGYSYYDLQKHICSPYYHDFHIELLNRIIEKFPENIFKEMREKWSKGSNANYLIRSVKHPTKRSVSLIIFSFFSLIFIMELVFILFRI